MSEPLPVCHLNGALLPLREARISPLDRSFLFGDGIYEVIAARGGRPKRLAANLARLSRSLAAVRIPNPHDPEHWAALIAALIAANGGGDQYIYLQVSRGTEWGRNLAPLPKLEPTVFAFCAPLPPPSPEALEHGVSCVTAEDFRWGRCDIKAVTLLANALLRQVAVEAQAAETILLRDGWLTEATSSAVHVVLDGQICTPPLSHQLLPGTTRGLIEELAERHGLPWCIRPVSEAQLRGASEIWLSATVRGFLAVTRLDGKPIGNGRPGPLWQQTYALVREAW